MPELPEVETVASALRLELLGKTIVRLESGGGKLRFPLVSGEGGMSLEGREVRDVRRRARYIIIELEDCEALVVHLGMTGSLRIDPPGDGERLKHDHLRFWLSGGGAMVYNDPRRFGFIVAAKLPKAGADPERLAGLGVEPLSPKFNSAYLLEKTSRTPRIIKTLLMDNNIVVGVGNIYANEALFAAGIAPDTPAKNLNGGDCQRLVAAVRKILRAAIRAGGTTFRDFRGLRGDEGKFVRELNVYGRGGMPCPRCAKGVVRRQVHSGRSSFFCPECQRPR